MEIIFTLCSNNYLAQATVLGYSVKEYHPEFVFIAVLVDEKSSAIDYASFPFEVLPIRQIEPDIDRLWEKYDIIELNTSVKPRVVEYLFSERNADKVIYMDPDIRLYDQLSELKDCMREYDIVLTPHIYSPIPMDGRTPGENTFLNYGIYNLGFIGINNTPESARFVNWWKERTYQQGYFRVKDGFFVDQLPINLVPLFFKAVFIIQHLGYNMAPWNLHERYLSFSGNGFVINSEDKLKFYHFSSFKMDSEELPLHYYDRFSMKERPDLAGLYADYNSRLKQAGYGFYSAFKCEYVTRRQALLDKQRQEDWKKRTLLKRMALNLIFRIPSPIRRVLSSDRSNYL